MNLVTNMELFEQQEQLELSKAQSIEQFMFDQFSVDWFKKPVLVELAELLKATMKLENGWWVAKDILD